MRQSVGCVSDCNSPRHEPTAPYAGTEYRYDRESRHICWLTFDDRHLTRPAGGELEAGTADRVGHRPVTDIGTDTVTGASERRSGAGAVARGSDLAAAT